MIPSPLSLDTYYFTKIDVAASGIDLKDAGTGVINNRLNIKRHKEDPRKFMLTFGLRQKAEKGKAPPAYTFEFDIVGFVTVIAEYPEDKVDTLVKVNGPAILYASIREMVANLTARGPFPAVALPTVTFVDEAKKQPAGLDASEFRKKASKALK